MDCSTPQCVPTTEPGSYGKDAEGEWWVNPPKPGIGAGCIGSHEVVEHEDGTITVSPSILSQGGPNGSIAWHGYLERGVWREV